MSKRFRVSLAAMVAVVLVLAIWAVWVEPRRLVVREVAIALPDLSPSAAAVRVAVLTDLHVGSPHHDLDRLREIVRAVNRTKPDVVLILGDFVTTGVVAGSFVAPEAIAPMLGALVSRFGTFAVLGNHDWWFDATRVATALRSAGVVLLEDDATCLTTDSGPLWLAGVSDLWEGAHDINAALADVANDEPVILFTHNPDIFPEVPASVDLTVAGHTHGGQVNLPLLGRVIVPSRFGERYAAGHVIEGGRQLFVSTGTGTSILPVRFRVPPEIVVLRVGPAAQ